MNGMKYSEIDIILLKVSWGVHSWLWVAQTMGVGLESLASAEKSAGAGP